MKKYILIMPYSKEEISATSQAIEVMLMNLLQTDSEQLSEDSNPLFKIKEVPEGLYDYIQNHICLEKGLLSVPVVHLTDKNAAILCLTQKHVLQYINKYQEMLKKALDQTLVNLNDLSSRIKFLDNLKKDAE